MQLATPRPGPRAQGPDGTEIATWELGGDGPPLLFTHGTGLTSAMWFGVAPLLAGYRCIGVDMRGHGGSGPSPNRRYDDWWLSAGDLVRVIDGLGLVAGDVAGVGHSFGAASLLLAELTRPGTFAALWCFEPILPPEEGLSPDDRPSMADLSRHRRNHFESVEAAVGRFSPKPPFVTWQPELVEAYVRTATRPSPEGVSLVLSGAEEATCYEGSMRHGAARRLGELTLPVTVAAATDDALGPAAWAPGIAERLPNGRLRPLAGVSHFGPLEEPARIAAALAADLADMGYPPAGADRSPGAVAPRR